MMRLFRYLVLTCLIACSSDAGPNDVEDVSDGGAPKDASSKSDAAGRDAGNAGGDEGRDSGGPLNRTDAGPSRDGGVSSAGDAAIGDARAEDARTEDAGGLQRFSFFVTSLKAMRALSESQNGFGGDLRFGETGDGAGLRGADKICTTTAEMSMPGASAKNWRAFLSATRGPDGGPVHAIDRVGEGPWYDREGRVVALTKTDLTQVRPASADDAIKNDLPNEEGIPNHAADGVEVDNHHVLTGSSDKGQLYADDPSATCDDWTKSAAEAGDAPRCGLSWPRAGGRGASAQHWLSAVNETGCAPAVSIVEMGGPPPGAMSVGSGGGYGAIYCFALTP